MNTMAPTEQLRVLHVIAAFDLNEAQGRAAATIAAYAPGEHHLVCGELHHPSEVFTSVTTTGAALHSFGWVDCAQLSTVVATVRPDVIHLHGGPLLGVSMLRGWSRQVPALASVYAWPRVSLAALRSGIPLGHLRSTPVLAPRTVVNTAAPPALVVSALKRAGVRMALTQDPEVRDLAAAQALPTLLAEGITPPSTARPGTLRPTARFLFAGRAELTRGPDLLADAVERLRGEGFAAKAEFFFRCARDAEMVKQLTQSPNCAVRIGDVDLAAEISNATAVVLPFRFDTTTLAPALVATEAMALGVPVVGGDVHCLRTAVSHGRTGLLAAPGDVGALTTALRSLAADPALATQLGTAAASEIDHRWRSSGIADAAAWAYRTIVAGSIQSKLNYHLSTH